MEQRLFDLTGKVAVVTGACGLLGREHCKALAAAGAQVVVTDVNKEDCRQLAESLGPQHLAISIDVTNTASLEMAKELVLLRYNRLDILVNNAAINDKFEDPLLAGKQSMFEHYPLKLWEQSWQVNVTGVFLCAQVFGSVMVKQGSGSIINVASTYGIVGPDQSIYKNEKGEQAFFKSPAYPVTKSAVLGFTRYLAAYWGAQNIRVNALSPGGVQNGQEDFFVQNYNAKTPLKRMALANDYQGALVFLASDASAYMTGANLVVDGGWTAI
jgi:NAD(P)-dependent dehydrogenase (short-subunit alcohol dehydrogenase family)